MATQTDTKKTPTELASYILEKAKEKGLTVTVSGISVVNVSGYPANDLDGQLAANWLLGFVPSALYDFGPMTGKPYQSGHYENGKQTTKTYCCNDVVEALRTAGVAKGWF